MRRFLFILVALTAFVFCNAHTQPISAESQCAPIYLRMGDTNADCTVDINDAIALKSLVWAGTPASAHPQLDLNQSGGNLDNTDILIMQMYLAGRIDHLPVLDGSIDASPVTTRWGDCNGSGTVTVADVSVLANILAGNITPTPTQRATCDVNWDGHLNIQDLATLSNWLAGNISVLPVIPPS